LRAFWISIRTSFRPPSSILTAAAKFIRRTSNWVPSGRGTSWPKCSDPAGRVAIEQLISRRRQEASHEISKLFAIEEIKAKLAALALRHQP
jgi:hypothetical protein